MHKEGKDYRRIAGPLCVFRTTVGSMMGKSKNYGTKVTFPARGRKG